MVNEGVNGEESHWTARYHPLMRRKYWITQHWPRPIDAAHDPGWHIFLQDRYRNHGQGISIGDGVLFYEIEKGPTAIDAKTGKLIPLREGRKAVVAIGSVIGREEPAWDQETVYEDGTRLKWGWRYRCGFLEEGSPVPYDTLLNVIEKGSFRPYGGLTDLSESKFQALAELLLGRKQTFDDEAGVDADDSDASDISSRIIAREGRVRYARHLVRERQAKLVQAKKQQVMAQHGCLRCEVCSIDFARAYGVVGEGFIECHHLNWLSHSGETDTSLDDLALICPNCHRMMHRGGFRHIAELQRVMC